MGGHIRRPCWCGLKRTPEKSRSGHGNDIIGNASLPKPPPLSPSFSPLRAGTHPQ